MQKKVTEKTKELNDLNEKLEIILHSIGDALIVTDFQGKITLMNSVAEQLTEWKLEDAIGRDLKEVFNIVNGITLKPAKDPVKKGL